MDPAMEVALSVAIEPDTDFTAYESRVAEPLDSSPAMDSEPPVPIPVESDWAPIMEFTSADIFQHSLFGDILNSLRSLSLSGDSRPNYVRLEWEADDVELRFPPTTHFVATVDDLTDMLDFNSEDIDGMDDDVGDEHEPAPIGRWTSTSSYDVYMVDTQKKTTTRNGRTHRRLVPSRSSQSGGASAAPNPASPEITTTQTQRWSRANHCRTMAIRKIKLNKPIPSKITVRTTQCWTGTRSNRMPVKGLLPPRGA